MLVIPAFQASTQSTLFRVNIKTPLEVVFANFLTIKITVLQRFFNDSILHMTNEGAELRTKRLIKDLEVWMAENYNE